MRKNYLLNHWLFWALF